MGFKWEDRGGSVFAPIPSKRRQGTWWGTHRELDAEIFGPEEMHHPRDPALLLRELLALIRRRRDPHPISSQHRRTRGARTRTSCTRRDAPRPRGPVLLIPHEDMTQLQDALDVLRGVDHGLVLEYARDDRVGDAPPRSVRLVVQELLVAREGEEREDVDVVLDRGEQEREEVRGRGRVVDVGGRGVRGALVQGKGEDLVDVGELGRVAREREVRERDEQGRDVLDRQVRPGLNTKVGAGKGRTTVSDESRALADRPALTLIKLTTCCQNTSNNLTSSGIPRNLRTLPSAPIRRTGLPSIMPSSPPGTSKSLTASGCPGGRTLTAAPHPSVSSPCWTAALPLAGGGIEPPSSLSLLRPSSSITRRLRSLCRRTSRSSRRFASSSPRRRSSGGSFSASLAAYEARRSIMAITMDLMATFGCSCAVAERNGVKVTRWKSGVKTCGGGPWSRSETAGIGDSKLWAHLDDDLHEVLLCDDVLAVDDLFEDAREDDAAVHLEVDAVELTQADEVGPDEDAELAALEFAAVAVAAQAGVLQADPELVHLDKVGQDEADRVVEVAARAGVVSDGEVVAGHAAEVVAEEEAAGRVLYAAGHLHHVLHDFLDGAAGDGHVDCADGDHEVEARDDVAGVLDEFVQVGEVVLAGLVGVVQVRRQVAERVKDGHICVGRVRGSVGDPEGKRGSECADGQSS